MNINKKDKTESKYIISKNNISVKVWDDQAIEAVNNVSKALLNMTKLFKSQNISIIGIKIENTDSLPIIGEKSDK